MRTSILNNRFKTSVSLFFLLVIAFLIQSVPAFSQDENEADKKAPLHVTSNKMVAVQNTSMVEFIGDVKATRLDSILLADSVKVYFNQQAREDKGKKEDSTVQSNLKKIISEGNVRYTAGERKAFADKAVYTARDDSLVLTGKSPKLVTGSSFVTGKKITWFRQQDKVIVESDGNSRVEALFNPEDKLDNE